MMIFRRFQYLFLTCLATVSLAAGSRGNEAPPAAEAGPPAGEKKEVVGKGMALAVVGNLDPVLVEKVRAFSQYRSSIPLRLREVPQPVKATTLFDYAEGLKTALTDEDVCLIALVELDTKDEGHAVYTADRRVALINVNALKKGNPEPDVFQYRLDKLVSRSTGLLMGVDMVPMPLSSMYPYKDLEELDRIARAIDPPTLIKVQKAAVELGITLDPESPHGLPKTP